MVLLFVPCIVDSVFTFLNVTWLSACSNEDGVDSLGEDCPEPADVEEYPDENDCDGFKADFSPGLF